MKSARQLLANIAVTAFVVGLFLAYAGVIVTFYGITGETDLEFPGRTFKSENVGVALISLGAALILLNIRRISKRFVVAIAPIYPKIGQSQLARLLEREYPDVRKAAAARVAFKERQEGITAGNIGGDSHPGRDASHNSREQVHTHLPAPDEQPRTHSDLKILSSVPDAGRFVGREAELECLQAFFGEVRQHLVVLTGSGGVGKTALAAQAVRDCVEDLSLVFWHRFSEELPSLDTLFLKLRTFFQGHGDQSLSGMLENPEATTEDRVNAVITALSRQAYYLVFDDLQLLLDRHHQIQHPGLQRLFGQFLPGRYPGLVMLVSRIEPAFERRLLGDNAKVDLGRLGEQASHELITTLRNPSESPDIWRKVYESTEGNPQEMRLLSGLPEQQSLGLLEDVSNPGEDFQDRLFELVAQKLEEAERRFLLVAITHRGPITEEVFRYQVGKESGGTLEPLQRLVERGVLSYDEKNESYRLNGLLRQHLVEMMFEEEAQVQAHAKAARYYDGFPLPEEPASYDQVLAQVEASYHYFRARQYAKAAPFRLSKYFLRWGLHELHRGMWERVRDHLGGKELSTCYNQLGLIYRAQRKYDEALECYLATERIGKKVKDRAILGPTYNNIGEIYRVRGEYDKALDYYLDSEKIRKEAGDRAGLGPIYNNIGLIKYSQGEYKTAQQYLERSYEIFCQLSAHVEAEQVKENLQLLPSMSSSASLSEELAG